MSLMELNEFMEEKKVEHKQEYAEATNSIEAVKDPRKPMTPEISYNLSREQRASDGVSLFPWDWH